MTAWFLILIIGYSKEQMMTAIDFQSKAQCEAFIAEYSVDHPNSWFHDGKIRPIALAKCYERKPL